MDAEWAMPDFEDMLSLPETTEVLPVSQTPVLGSLSLERLLSTGRVGGIMADDDLSTPTVKVELSEATSMPVNELSEQALFRLEEAAPTTGIAPSAFAATTPAPASPQASSSSASSSPEPLASLPTSKRTRRPLGAPRRPLGAPRRAPSPTPDVESPPKRLKSEPAREVSPSPTPSAPRDPLDKEQYIKEKNRDAARLFRQRRKDYLRNLEDELRRSQEKQAALEARARELEVANIALRNNVQTANQRLERQELELQRLRAAAEVPAASTASAPVAVAASTAAGSITIPPMSELKESLDVRQLAQVVVCLMIIANIVGPIAGWDIPAMTEALPADAAHLVLTARSARKTDAPKSDEETANVASAPPTPASTPSAAAPATVAISVVSGSSAPSAAPSSIDLNSAPAQLISSYLTAMDPTVLAYLVMSAHKARAAGGLDTVAAASS